MFACCVHSQSLVAECLAALLHNQGIQGVDAIDVVAGGDVDARDLQKFDGLAHFGLLEPHVRPYLLMQCLVATACCTNLSDCIRHKQPFYRHFTAGAETFPKLCVDLPETTC